MVGPLFYQEMLLASRRTRNYMFRWIYACWLLLEVGLLSFVSLMEFFTLSQKGQAAYLTPLFAQSFVAMFIKQHFILLILTVPTFVAGAITDEKNRGTLQYLLISDLSSLQIVLGKWLGRVTQVAMLALTGVPWLFLLGEWGGMRLLALCAFMVLTVLLLGGLGAAAMLASVWSRQTRDAILGLYSIGIVTVLLGGWVEGPFVYFDPYYVLEPVLEASHRDANRELLQRLGLACIAWGGLGCCCFALAAWRLRPAYLRQLENSTRRRQPRWWRVERVQVTDEPLRWKERNVDGLAPLQILRHTPRWLGILCIFLGTCCTSSFILSCFLPAGVTLDQALGLIMQGDLLKLANSLLPAETGFQMQGIVAMLCFSLLVGIRCSGTISGERERRTWEALLLTPLTTQQLIRQKHWGILAASYGYVAAYALPAVAFSLLGGMEATFWTVLWLGVTFLVMYFVGAAGIWCSVRSKNSWRSLLGTLAWSYVGGAIIYCLTTPILGIVAALFLLMFIFVNAYLGNPIPITAGGAATWFLFFKVGSFVSLVAICWGLARIFLRNAQNWVADRERTRHWHHDPGLSNDRPRAVQSQV